MKILNVIPTFVPAYSYGGPLKICFDISKKLVKRGYEVTVITSDAYDEKNRILLLEEEIEGIKIKRFRNVSNKLAKKYNAYLPLTMIFWLKNHLKNYDIVYCHDTFTLLNISVGYYCKKYNVPYVFQPHGTLAPISIDSRFKMIKLFFLKIFKGFISNSNLIVALTEKEKKQISTIDSDISDKIVVIPNGLSINEYEGIKKINLHEKYKIPPNLKTIGFIGRIQYIKGIDLSLEILSKVRKTNDFAFLIIGPDEGEKSKLENIITDLGMQETVFFTGLLSGKEKLEVINSCDLFLFTSRSEGLPMSILEVSALGKPQVISDTCNVPEIELYKAGYVIKLSETDIFVEKIVSILNHVNIDTISKNAISMTKNIFNLESICDKIESLLKQLII